MTVQLSGDVAIGLEKFCYDYRITPSAFVQVVARDLLHDCAEDSGVFKSILDDTKAELAGAV